jgi:LacI family transcriptional regulator
MLLRQKNTFLRPAVTMAQHRRVALMLDLEWPYKRHTAVFAGAQRYAQEQDWHTIIDEYADDTIATAPKKLRYDGIIARATKKLALRAEQLKTPLVNVWSSSPVLNSVPTVMGDFVAAGQLRAEHLLSRGLSRFALLTSEGDRSQDIEAKHFNATLKAAGCTSTWIMTSMNPTVSVQEWRKCEKAISEWMDSWELPIGVFVGSDSDGRMVAQMCRNRGWRVPEDVAIISGRNEETYCERLRPTLTSVEIGYERIGYEAAKLLDQLMDGKPAPEEIIVVKSQQLIVRESTDFLAVDEPIISAALKFIATHCHRNIGQDDVARAVSMETRTLQRRFRKYINRPIAAEIRRVRLERAKRELAQGNRSLAEIARDVGFGEAMRMYEVFKRELGVTPSQYRKERQISFT